MNDYEGQKEEYGYSENYEKTSNWKIWLMFLIPVLIIFGLVIFFYVNFSSTTISDSKFTEGATIDLKENKQADFTVGDEEHFIKINSIGLDSVELTIQSDPIKLQIKIGEEREVDINGDGLMDVIVKLVSIENNIPKVYMRRIYEERKKEFEERKNETIEGARENLNESELNDLERRIRNASTVWDLDELEGIVNNSLNGNLSCVEKWECENWRNCSNGVQIRICIDKNHCGTIKFKPELTRNCNLSIGNNCTESWGCGNWSSCTTGKQTRICNDLNSCGSVLNKPEIEKNCEIDDSNNQLCEDKGAVFCGENICNGAKVTYYNFPEGLYCCNGECIEKISDEKLEIWSNLENSGECNYEIISNKFYSCTPYKCSSINEIYSALTGLDTQFEKGVIGYYEGECHYYEEIPWGVDKGTMYCKYDEPERLDIAQYYEDLIGATQIVINNSGYFVDGVEKENYLQEALDRGDCYQDLPY